MSQRYRNSKIRVCGKDSIPLPTVNQQTIPHFYPKTRIEIKIVAINSWIENVWTYPLFNLSRSLPLYINHEHIWFKKTYSYLPDFITIHFKLYISGEKSDFPWSYSKQSVSLIDTICKNTYFCKSANSCWFENLAPSSIIFI